MVVDALLDEERVHVLLECDLVSQTAEMDFDSFSTLSVDIPAISRAVSLNNNTTLKHT